MLRLEREVTLGNVGRAGRQGYKRELKCERGACVLFWPNGLGVTLGNVGHAGGQGYKQELESKRGVCILF